MWLCMVFFVSYKNIVKIFVSVLYLYWMFCFIVSGVRWDCLSLIDIVSKIIKKLWKLDKVIVWGKSDRGFVDFFILIL